MKPKRDSTRTSRALLWSTLASAETSAEAVRAAVEELRSAWGGREPDAVADHLGVSLEFARELVKPTVDPYELLRLTIATRLEFALEVQQNPAWRLVGLVGCTAQPAGLTLLWYQPHLDATTVVSARARALGVSITHDTFPASPAAVDEVMLRVTTQVGLLAISDVRMSSSGLSITIMAADTSTVRDLREGLPDWAILIAQPDPGAGDP